MSGCLRDRALLLLYYGGGNSSQQTHLTECEACAARYRQVGRDLEAISQVLREKPLPKTVTHRFHPFTVRWLPIGAALALALLLVWVSARIWNPSARSPVGGTDNGETWSFVEEFPSTLFLLNEAIAGDLRTGGAGSYDLAAAVLEADRPCEWYDLPAMATAESSPGDLEISGSLPFATCVEVEVKSGTTRMKPKT
jgi:hypothetical protein